MASIPSKDTGPELMLRQALHARGLRYRLHGDLPGKPDLVFASARVAVFVDGDFWHGHGWRERGFDRWEAQFDGHRDPAKWRAKIGRNIRRDAEVNDQLDGLGWKVVRVLESAIRRDLAKAVGEVESAVRIRRSGTGNE